MAKRKRGLYRRRREMQEIIHGAYGLVTAPALAVRVERETGIVISPHGLSSAARDFGINVKTAQGLWCVADAARELGIAPRTLRGRLARMGVKMVGRGMCRFLPDGLIDELRARYADPPEPTVSIREAANLLCYSRSQTSAMVLDGRIRAYRHETGTRAIWRVSLVAIQEYKQS